MLKSYCSTCSLFLLQDIFFFLNSLRLIFPGTKQKPKRFRVTSDPTLLAVFQMLGTLTAVPIKVPQISSLNRLAGHAATVLPQVNPNDCIAVLLGYSGSNLKYGEEFVWVPLSSSSDQSYPPHLTLKGSYCPAEAVDLEFKVFLKSVHLWWLKTTELGKTQGIRTISAPYRSGQRPTSLTAYPLVPARSCSRSACRESPL